MADGYEFTNDWFAVNAPGVVRGLVMTENDGRAFSKWNIRKRLRRQLLRHPRLLPLLAHQAGRQESRTT